MSSWKDLYSEVKKRKMEALNKKDVVKVVEEQGKILAINGKYEKPEKIIKHMYASEKKVIKPEDLLKVNLNQYDVVLIGCPGSEIPHTTHTKIIDFVSNGGWLITTDWTLHYIIESVFPGYIRWNKRKTRGKKEIVNCQILKPNHPFLDSVISEIQQKKWTNQSRKNVRKSEFRWWLEIRSYPIQILNHEAVQVLIASQEIKQKYGEAPVLVYFDYGKKGGRVIHMISHAHLQKGSLRGKYASALILTNILDEKISQKTGISTISSPHQRSFQPTMEDRWVAPPQQTDYVTPTATESKFGESRISQIVEANVNNFSFASKCAYCGYDFSEFTGKIYVCKECGAPYHYNCLNTQISEGVCKNCNRILLW